MYPSLLSSPTHGVSDDDAYNNSDDDLLAPKSKKQRITRSCWSPVPKETQEAPPLPVMNSSTPFVNPQQLVVEQQVVASQQQVEQQVATAIPSSPTMDKYLRDYDDDHDDGYTCRIATFDTMQRSNTIATSTTASTVAQQAAQQAVAKAVVVGKKKQLISGRNQNHYKVTIYENAKYKNPMALASSNGDDGDHHYSNLLAFITNKDINMLVTMPDALVCNPIYTHVNVVLAIGGPETKLICLNDFTPLVHGQALVSFKYGSVVYEKMVKNSLYVIGRKYDNTAEAVLKLDNVCFLNEYAYTNFHKQV